MGGWILSKAFSASVEISIWCLSFSITLIDLHILKNPCIPGINPTWSWCVSFLMWCEVMKLSSVLFILFTLFCASEVISTILSSTSLIHSSASDILLLIPSRVFLISVIVLFISVCLFFNSSRSLLIDSYIFLHFVFKDFYHLYCHYSVFFFQVVCLFPLHLFGLLCF